MYASITESKTEKGRYGVEIGNSKETFVNWMALDKVGDQENRTLRDVILLLGFDTVGTWSLRNRVSRIQVRPVTKLAKPLESPEPSQEEFLE